MNRRRALLGIVALPLGSGLIDASTSPWRGQAAWTTLEFADWDRYLGKPYKASDVRGQPRNDAGEYTQPLDLNNDPNGVFSSVTIDGGPAIRISGEIFGALISREAFENYHLRFQFKWGEKKWPPREQVVRDSGCCYHSIGPHGASYGFWMRSFEFQLQEGDCGDFYSLAGVTVDCEAIRREPANASSELLYRRGAPTIVGHTKRIVKDADHERPTGQWNTIELYAVGQTSVHVVNGATNLVLTGLRHRADDREVPLTSGRIQLQSEGAEVFYRNIAIRRIDAIPATILRQQARSVTGRSAAATA